MRDLIELKSRGDEYCCLRKLTRSDGKESSTYLLKTSAYSIKRGFTSEGKSYIQPVGGPRIEEGGTVEGLKVISIDYVVGMGYALTLEEEKEEGKELVDNLVEL